MTFTRWKDRVDTPRIGPLGQKSRHIPSRVNDGTCSYMFVLAGIREKFRTQKRRPAMAGTPFKNTSRERLSSP
ncbi:hypothetical protein GCM10025778_24970 [Paeniglutamicibacter antarcticus]|uniref:Uncharacterized protein n=1 Tax=Paeniglutamicibacter antarcticus TaxID=494023 RepID=A0ABP9TS91_9MICC